MKREIIQLVRFFVWLVAGSATVCIIGCNVSSKVDMETRAAATMPATLVPVSQKSDVPGINLQCDVNLIRNAPAPFHWSLKIAATPGTNADWEADITHDSIAGTYVGASGARTIHGVRSDSSSMQTAFAMFPFSSMAGHFNMLSNSSAMTAEGRETVRAAGEGRRRAT